VWCMELRSWRKSLVTTTTIIVMSLIAIILAPTVASQSGIEVSLKVYMVNLFGWELTHVITKVHAELATPNSFDTRLSYTSREAWSAWWCFTCSANANSINIVINAYTVGEDTAWTQATWNVRYDGVNHVWVYAYGNYYVREKVYCDINGVTNTVIDAIKNAINFIVDIFSKLL